MYPAQDKISQTKISHFVQDNKGYLWFGTLDGLVRFDGQQTQIYKTYPGDSVHVGNHRVMKLQCTRSGNLWVNTYGRRSYLFDTDRYQYIDVLGPYTTEVRQLYVLDNGIAWAHAENGKLLRVDEQESPIQVTPVELPFAYREIYDVKTDYAGNEWILTDRGSYIYTRSRQVGSIPYKFLANMGQHLYLATTDHVYDYHINTAQELDLHLQLPEPIKELISLPSRTLLMRMTTYVSLYHIDTQKLHTYPLDVHGVSYVMEDSHNRIWILGNRDEIYRIENDELFRVPYIGERTAVGSTDMHYVFEDDYGTLWLQSGRGLPLSYYDQTDQCLHQGFTFEDGQRRPIDIYLRSGGLDAQHNLWGNVDGVGFCYCSFARQRVSFIGEEDDHAHGADANALLVDHMQRLWVGWRNSPKSETGNINLYDSLHHLIGYIGANGAVTKDRSQALQLNPNCIVQDSHERIWIGTRNAGLYVLERLNSTCTNYRIYHYMHSNYDSTTLAGNYIMDVLEDHNGKVWIGTYGYGLDCVDDSLGLSRLQFKHTPGLGLADRHIRTLYETNKHRLLIGHNNGLWVGDLDKPELKLYLNQSSNSPNCLSNNNVTDVTELSDGRIAISTFGGGINLLPSSFEVNDSLRFSCLNARNSNLPDVVLSVTQAPRGQIWVVGENNLTYYSHDFVPLSSYLRNTTCNECAPVIDPRSEDLCMATKHEVLCLDDNDNRSSRFEPNIVFTELMMHRNDTTSACTQLTPADSTLHFKASDRNFTIHFSALDFENRQGILYAYRLLPKMEQWIPLQNQSSVTLAELPGGDYTLQVRSSNSDGIWSSRMSELQVSIGRYYYETIWFKMLMWTLAAVMLGLVIYTIMHRVNTKRKLAMQNQISEAKVKFITEVTQRQDTADEIFTRKLMRLVQDNVMNEGFNIEQAAAELNLSYPVLYRKVKSLMDMTPVELVRQVRMQRAQRLLTERPNMSIAEVASMCGFGSPQYFNRVFKEMAQCTPAEFKKKAQAQKVQADTPATES